MQFLFEYEYAYHKFQLAPTRKLKLHWRSICQLLRQRLTTQLYSEISNLHWTTEHQPQSTHISRQLQSAIIKICSKPLIIN